MTNPATHPPAPATRPHLLPRLPDLPNDLLGQVRADFERFAQTGLPPGLEPYLLQKYGLDVTGSYAGMRVRNPWGKASGQLSMRLNQIEEATGAGLGFVVLKTVIAEDAGGGRSMEAWAIKESRMVAEPIVGRETGERGWTVSWKGRGWWQPFEDYLDLVRAARALGQKHEMLVIPSVKYHLPAPGETRWRVEEYTTTTQRLLEAYGDGVMPLEKDFSPTLAGSDRAGQQAKILEWLATIPGLIRDAAAPRSVVVGLKLFNALFDDAFQLTMLAAVHGAGGPDFVVYANRLFDPERVFDGHRGIAYGGPDLSHRNLRVLSAHRAAQAASAVPARALPISGTGDIGSGRMAVEYALRGCTSFQIHTYFQLPPEVYAMKRGTKIERALHMLYFHP
jgi:dihydroorotate dehydrogenase